MGGIVVDNSLDGRSERAAPEPTGQADPNLKLDYPILFGDCREEVSAIEQSILDHPADLARCHASLPGTQPVDLSLLWHLQGSEVTAGEVLGQGSGLEAAAECLVQAAKRVPFVLTSSDWCRVQLPLKLVP